MSDTPETDACDKYIAEPFSYELVPAEFAEKLERERDQLRVRIEKTRESLAFAKSQNAKLSDQGRVNCMMYDDMKRMQSELATLRASQMTEERAREVLGKWIDNKAALGSPCIGGISEASVCLRPKNDSAKANEFVRIRGVLCADQLEAIAWWMRNKGDNK